MKSQEITHKSEIINPKSRPRVFVGLSGGVDSAVSAALLKKDGYDVTGVFIKAWTPPGYPCTWREDRRSAMRAAAVLDIPFITLDLENEYKTVVVDYMIGEYRKGRTPNPDVMCNKEIKFGAFLDWARKQGADFVATGHYAMKVDGRKQEVSPMSDMGLTPCRTWGLAEAKDKNKDQSYFLWTLAPEQLAQTLFPIGHLQKDEVRKLAKKFGLPQAMRKDSQGLCFLGQVDMKEFLSRYIEEKPGNVLSAESGEVIGTHNGAVFFTIGERHGFTITQKTPGDAALYVVAKDIEKNTITVAPKITQHLKCVEGAPLHIQLEEVNWIVDPKQVDLGNVSCRLRYRQEKIPCTVTVGEEGEVIVRLNENNYASPGQSLVFYDGELCLGGGIMR